MTKIHFSWNFSRALLKKGNSGSINGIKNPTLFL